MSFLSNIKERIASSANESKLKRKEEKEFEDRLKLEQQVMERIEFEKAFTISARKTAILKAKRDADKKTGLAKLRAINNVSRLEQQQDRPLSKLAKFMHKNMQRRDENMKRTKLLQDEAKKMQQEKLSKTPNRQQLPRQQQTQRPQERRKAFQGDGSFGGRL